MFSLCYYRAMNSNLDNLTAADLRRAADVRDEIEQLEQELAQILSGRKKPGPRANTKRAGRKPGPKAAPTAATNTAATNTVAKKKGGRKRTQAEKDAHSKKMKAYWAKKKRD
ncbi:MAG: hypothetical protein ACI9MB_004093, partial [Verrucomicrobiales bacterium]